MTFEDIASAQRALRKHNGCEVEGREIEVRFAEDRGGGGGRGGSGGFGRGGGGFDRGGSFDRGGGRGRVDCS